MQRRKFVAALLSGLFLAACQQKTNKKINTKKAARLRLGYSASPGRAAIAVAQAEGILPGGVVPSWHDSYANSLKGLTGGQLDANLQTLADTIVQVANGADLVVILVTEYSAGSNQLIGSGVSSLDALRGRDVAVEHGSADHFLLCQALSAAGIAKSEVGILPLPTADAINIFIAGKVDAVGAPQLLSKGAFARAGSKVLASSKDFLGSISDHLVFRREYVNAHPAEVQSMVDAWFATQEHIKKHQEKSVAIMANRLQIASDEYVQASAATRQLSQRENLDALVIKQEMSSLYHAAAATQQFLKEEGFIQSIQDLSQLFDRRFLDNQQ